MTDTYRCVISGRGRISYKFPIDIHNYDYCVVPVASIPKTYYSLPNDAVLSVNENGSLTDLTFTAGTYSYTSLKYILESKLNTLTYTYVVSIPTAINEVQTGKYTIVVSDNAGVQPTITTTDTYLARQLGFDVDTVYTFEGNTLISADFCNFQPYAEILIKSNLVNNHERILQEVYSSANIYNSNIDMETNDRETHKKYINKSAGINQTYDFYLETPDGGSVNLNGNSWSFSLVLFKESQLEKKITEYIKYKVMNEL